MQLTINNLLPLYFPETRRDTSDIWGKHLTVLPGEKIKIVAPSGSGKTSLMHFLYGLRSDYDGTITCGSQVVKNASAENIATLRKNSVSIVLQDLRLLPEQSVYQNLYLKHQLNPYHPVEKINQMAQRLRIGDKLSSLCKTCSYGEQQRVAIIRALLQPFNFLLLDEPFSHLDEANAKRAMELMLEEADARGASIIFADLERINFFPSTRLYHL